MKKILLLPFFMIVVTAVFSQPVIEVSYVLDRQGNMVFSCNNRGFCPCVVKVDFPLLQNAHSDHALPYEAELKPGVSKIFVLTQVDKSTDIQVKYKTSFRKGCMQPVVNPNFTYLLPMAPGKEGQVYRIPNSGGQDSGYAIRIRMKQGDTIYAARRGVVTAVGTGNAENDQGVTVTDSWNSVEIYQKDCSFAQYGVLKKDGALVKPGQVVEAGTPIGIVGGDQYGRGSDIRFSVSYYPGVNNTAINLHFWSKGNGKGTLRHGALYTSEFPKALVMQETPKPSAKGPAKKKS